MSFVARSGARGRAHIVENRARDRAQMRGTARRGDAGPRSKFAQCPRSIGRNQGCRLGCRFVVVCRGSCRPPARKAAIHRARARSCDGREFALVSPATWTCSRAPGLAAERSNAVSPRPGRRALQFRRSASASTSAVRTTGRAARRSRRARQEGDLLATLHDKDLGGVLLGSARLSPKIRAPGSGSRRARLRARVGRRDPRQRRGWSHAGDVRNEDDATWSSIPRLVAEHAMDGSRMRMAGCAVDSTPTPRRPPERS